MFCHRQEHGFVIMLVPSLWDVNMEKADQDSNELWWVMVEMGVDRCSLGWVSILVLMVMLLKLFPFKIWPLFTSLSYCMYIWSNSSQKPFPLTPRVI